MFFDLSLLPSDDVVEAAAQGINIEVVEVAQSLCFGLKTLLGVIELITANQDARVRSNFLEHALSEFAAFGKQGTFSANCAHGEGVV